MKTKQKFISSIILVFISLVLLELLYLITPEANQLSGNSGSTIILSICYIICLMLIGLSIKLMLKVSKLGVVILVIILVVTITVWPSYKSFPKNPLITTDELYSLSLNNNIQISNSDIYIHCSGNGWVEVKKIKYNELTDEEYKHKRIVGIRIKNSNFFDVIKLNKSGFYAIPILLPLKE